MRRPGGGGFTFGRLLRRARPGPRTVPWASVLVSAAAAATTCGTCLRDTASARSTPALRPECHAAVGVETPPALCVRSGRGGLRGLGLFCVACSWTLGACPLTPASARGTWNWAFCSKAGPQALASGRRGEPPTGVPCGPGLGRACRPEGRVGARPIGSRCSFGVLSWVGPRVAVLSAPPGDIPQSRGSTRRSKWGFLTSPGAGHLLGLRQVGPGVLSSTTALPGPKMGVYSADPAGKRRGGRPGRQARAVRLRAAPSRGAPLQ